MTPFDIIVLVSLVLGMVLLALYFKSESYDNDFVLIFGLVLLLFSLYFIIQKVTGFGSKKDGFRS